jgi:hypothetical protein
MRLRISDLQSIAIALGFFCVANAANAQVASNPVEYQAKVRRACEAAIWALPAVSIYDFELAIQRDLGGKLGDVVYVSKPFNSRHSFLTANDVTPYVFSAQTTKNGPLVIEIPPASDKAGFFGSFVDAWQRPFADVGLSGDDKGEGGKYLFLPPGFEGVVPDGYFAYPLETYSIHFAFRPVAKADGSIEDQVALSTQIKIYLLSEAGNPPQTTFIDGFPDEFNTLPVYDWTYFTDLSTSLLREPVLERDKAMMALLATLGIEKGKPFDPDDETKQAMLEGLQCAYDYLQNRFVTEGGGFKSIWEDRKWGTFAISQEQAKLGFPFVDDNRLLIDERAQQYFYLTYLPVKLGGGTFYLGGMRDADGNFLTGTDTYKLNVPADTPAEDFWSVIVYSMKSKGFIEDASVVGRATPNVKDMVKNDDGSVDVYFAPEAPEGMEANWIPTGEDWFTLFRLYGPKKGWYESGWKLSDIEKVK